jgi:hypothetical protein
MNTTSNPLPRGECLDDQRLRRALGRGLLCLLRGLATALFAPLDLLHSLHHRSRVNGRSVAYWLCSATLLLSAWGVWRLSLQPAAAPYARSGQLLLLALAALTAALLGGKLHPAGIAESSVAAGQPLPAGIHAFEFHGLGHHHHHGFDHHGFGRYGGRGGFRGRHHESPGSGIPGRAADDVRPSPPPAAAGICQHDCRICTNGICVKTGKPRRKVSA